MALLGIHVPLSDSSIPLLDIYPTMLAVPLRSSLSGLEETWSDNSSRLSPARVGFFSLKRNTTQQAQPSVPLRQQSGSTKWDTREKENATKMETRETNSLTLYLSCFTQSSHKERDFPYTLICNHRNWRMLHSLTIRTPHSHTTADYKTQKKRRQKIKLPKEARAVNKRWATKESFAWNGPRPNVLGQNPNRHISISRIT